MPDGEIKGIIFYAAGYGDHSNWLKKNLVTPIVKGGYAFITFDQQGHGKRDFDLIGQFEPRPLFYSFSNPFI